MEHHHHHHHHSTPAQSLNGIFILSIILNGLFILIEAGVGLWQNSLSLLSDAGHNLSDVFSLVLVLIAFRLAKVQRNERFTYGYRKSTILISLLNAVILLVAVGAIVIESIHKFSEPTEVNGSDLNVRGAFLHMAADTLVSIGVVISGIIIHCTGWTIIDPIMSLVIAAVILVSTWELLSDSLRLAVDGTPDGVDLNEIKQMLVAEEHVKDVHHIHVWAISTTETALTAHVVIDDFSCWSHVSEHLKHKLEEHNIAHATLEPETSDSPCHNREC